MKCCELSAGMLRNSITIERKVNTPDEIGGQSVAWVTLKTLKAAIKPTSGNEFYRAMRLEAKTTHDVIFRYTTDINPADRINFNGRYFQIRRILNVEERNKWLKLSCDEGVAQ